MDQRERDDTPNTEMPEVAADHPLLSPRFTDGLTYAATLHARQVRKGTSIPYVAHLLGVNVLVLEDGGDEDEAIAALLHDAVEDQGGPPTLAEIRRRYGDHVAAIVEGCSDTDVTPKPPWRERKERYLAHIKGAPPEVRRVSLADKLHNARAILADYRQVGDGLWSRFNAPRDEILWYYRSLVTAFREAGTTSPMLDEMDRVVSEVERISAANTPGSTHPPNA